MTEIISQQNFQMNASLIFLDGKKTLVKEESWTKGTFCKDTIIVRLGLVKLGQSYILIRFLPPKVVLPDKKLKKVQKDFFS